MSATLAKAESPLAHYLPYWWIGDNAIVTHDGAIAIAYKFQGVDPTCLPDEQLNSITRQLRTLLNALPIGFEVQIFRHSRPVPNTLYEEYLAALKSSHPILQEQRSRSAEHLRALNLRTFENYFVLSKPKALGRLGSHVRSPASRFLDRIFAAKDPTQVTRAEHNAALEQLTEQAESLLRHLKGAGVTQLQRLNDQALLALVYKTLNPARAAAGHSPVLTDEEPPSCLTPGQRKVWRALSLREQLIHASLTWDVDSLTLDDPIRLYRVMGLKALPRPKTVATLINAAAHLRFEHWLSVTLAVPDSERKFDEIEKRRNRAKVAAAGFTRDVKASVQAEELEAVLEAMTARDQRLFSLALNLLFSSDNLKQLDSRTQEAQDVFRRHLCGAAIATEQMNQLPAFVGMLPGNSHRAGHRRTPLTDNAADFIPIYQGSPGDSKPAFLATTRQGEPLRIDLADPRRTNWNCTVFGGSGGGKSFLVLSLATSTMLGQGSPLIVIDVGGKELGSYYRLATLVGGDFVGLSLDGANCINPFYSRADLLTTDEGAPSNAPNELKLSFLIAITKLLVADPGAPQLTRIEEAVLSRAIEATYQRIGDSRPPIFTDLALELEVYRGDKEDVTSARRFAKTLRAVIDGPFGKLINQQSRVSIRSPFVVFDLKGLENLGDIASVILLIVSAFVWNMIARPRQELAWIVYDECWKLLLNQIAAALQSELYRTARKLKAGVISVTQKLEDFLAAPASKAILSNTTSTFLLKHKDGHQAVADLLSMNEREQEIFKGLTAEKGHYSEFFLKQENGSVVGRYAPSPFEYWLNTTDAKDRELEEQVLLQVRGNRLAALRRLAAEYPHGAAGARRNA